MKQLISNILRVTVNLRFIRTENESPLTLIKKSGFECDRKNQD
ncbi:hypothetical protein [Microcoleus sp.]